MTLGLRSCLRHCSAPPRFAPRSGLPQKPIGPTRSLLEARPAANAAQRAAPLAPRFRPLLRIVPTLRPGVGAPTKAHRLNSIPAGVATRDECSPWAAPLAPRFRPLLRIAPTLPPGVGAPTGRLRPTLTPVGVAPRDECSPQGCAFSSSLPTAAPHRPHPSPRGRGSHKSPSAQLDPCGSRDPRRMQPLGLRF